MPSIDGLIYILKISFEPNELKTKNLCERDFRANEIFKIIFDKTNYEGPLNLYFLDKVF